jgi:hypothetical protein
MSGFASRVAARARDGVTVVFVVTTLTGVGSPSPVLVAPAMADPAGMYGDPPKAAQYWAPQSFGNNCVLMSVADVVGQVSGQMPSEQQIIDVAQTIPSATGAGATVYTDANGDGVDTRDIGVLLTHYGIHGTTSEDAKGQAALSALEAALGSRHAVMVPGSSVTSRCPSPPSCRPGGPAISR